LDADPADATAGALFVRALDALRERTFSQARTAEAVHDFAQADGYLAELLAVYPYDGEAAGLRAVLRGRWAEAARAAGQAALAAGDGARAEAHLREAIAADPRDTEARRLLAEARARASEGALRSGRELLAAGRFTEAIEAFAQAQARGASGPEIAARLRQARAGEALALGNQLYIDRQYAAALFQYKKVLRLDPDNREAAQKRDYAQNFLQDTQLSDRFTRLE
jgi:tetratricopeptide (TPR) repeat protein